ncbi:hypothetical protein LPJ81_003226 [Coemansia sp. IMI 209127]|nr:hypothetical protein LPJ81_003226 [Coemansia sp. IMI 209127]
MVLIATAVLTEAVEPVPAQATAAAPATAPVLPASAPEAAPAIAPVLPESAPAAMPAPAEPTDAAISAEVVEAAGLLARIAASLANIEPAAAAACLDIAENLIPPATAPVLPESTVAAVPAFAESTDVPIEDEIFVRPTSSLFWMSDDEDYEPLTNTPSLRLSGAPESLPSGCWDISTRYAPWEPRYQAYTNCSDDSTEQTADAPAYARSRIPSVPANFTFDIVRARADSRIPAAPTKLTIDIKRARAALGNTDPLTPVSIFSADRSPVSDVGGFYY